MTKFLRKSSTSFEWEPKTRNQVNLRSTILSKKITLSVGPAGTGKTFVTVCTAFEEFLKGRISGIVVSRPLIPAGQGFGYLPGTLQDKIDPFMQPIWEVIIDLNIPEVQNLVEGADSIVECVPIELMRGRTFTNKFIIIDEAQNCTPKQVELAMTRLGKESRMVFCGDTHQSDIRGINGLNVALELFKLEDEFGIVNFTVDDIQREGITKIVIERFQSFFSGDQI